MSVSKGNGTKKPVNARPSGNEDAIVERKPSSAMSEEKAEIASITESVANSKAQDLKMDMKQVGNIGNPSSNPDVLKNAMEDPTAIYGYRPNKTGNLKKFADKVWSDPEYVADMRRARIQYHIEHDAYAKVVEEMRSNGHSNTEIAKVLVDKRNTERMAYYVDEDGNISDMELYNQALEHCPTYQQLREGWGGKSPKTDEEIIESAAKSSPAFDACCGLYGH